MSCVGGLDEVVDVDVCGEVDFEVHGDAAVVGLAGVLDVQVSQRDFDDVGEDLVRSGVAGSAQAEFAAVKRAALDCWGKRGEACWREGGEGVGLVEVFVSYGDAAGGLCSLGGGVEEVVHCLVFGLEGLLVL